MRVALIVLGLALVAACSGETGEAAVTQTVTAEPAVTQAPAAAEESETEAPTPDTTPTEAATPQVTASAPAATGSASEEAGPVEITVTEVATGLQAPWALAFTPDGTAFVTERDTGRVLELSEDGGAEVVHEFAVDPAGEGGLLGLTVSPDYAQDGLLYAYYSTAEDNRIVRFQPGGEEDAIIDGIPKASIHNGGRVAFGPDGMLYVTTGDAGVGELAQDPDSLAGKVLRLTPDGGIPDDNPTAGSPVFTLGHRNVQGLAWDADGRLYATEFGPDRDDELNALQPGGNYGWPQVTGQAGVEEFIDPILVVQPPEAAWSGATILVDGAIPQWEGDLFAAALRGNRLWRVELAQDGSVAGTEELLVNEYGRLRFAVQAPDGSLWIGTNNRDGRGNPGPDDDRILRIGPPSG